jgi:hypothetical protein
MNQHSIHCGLYIIDVYNILFLRLKLLLLLVGGQEMILIAQHLILLYVADGLAAAARIGNLLYGFYNRGAA